VTAVQRRHLFLVLVAITAILAEFMPLLLNNIPFRLTQTWVAYEACTWGAVAVLALMLALVVASFFVAWPNLPADPATLAGAMYYVYESKLREPLAELAELGEKERNGAVHATGKTFELVQAAGMRPRVEIHETNPG
jgi:hypothetical protein